ncbi:MULTISPECIES: nucleoside triphosphate pyrophosphatase [unclassified Sphingomonas]|uniref:Maf family protein n=1 Tax=unclassified Sphingomonas TaxID=196159 RepID=UPI0016095FE3|nr:MULTISPECIES: nucleoside triphosphate pyrophosphatase [unclassified Sphingomonas]MBB3348119.1 septum formation protein [Sphingomonas sp. BK069]MBB3473800.1 septum formation protein [Sphingomonas sp. BK345]
MLILASQSASRTAMLSAAGVPFTAEPAYADEAALKAAMAGARPRDLADALAELKALKVSARHPGALVLGSDSLAVLDDGSVLDKPTSRDEARDHLRRMSGRHHDLVSAAVVAENGRPVWRVVDAARIIVRRLSDAFIETYLDAEWPAIAGCVGCYRIEGPGVQLFAKVSGSQFTVLGMPLLPVLDYLRTREVLPT